MTILKILSLQILLETNLGVVNVHHLESFGEGYSQRCQQEFPYL